MTVSRVRKIILINLLAAGPSRERTLHLGGIEFQVLEHDLGWDIDTARSLIRKYDGYADGIAISGVQKRITAGPQSLMHPLCTNLMRAAVKTPIYLADDIRELFAEWTLQKVLKEQPQIFTGKKVLFHCAVASSFLPRIAQAGAIVHAADPTLLPGIPLILKRMSQMETYARVAKAATLQLVALRFSPKLRLKPGKVQNRLERAIRESDAFVTLASLIELLPSLETLRGKLVIIDFLSDEVRARLEAVSPAQVIEFAPDHPHIEELSFKHYSVLSALIDQLRIAQDSPLHFDEYLLRWIQEFDIKPRKLRSAQGIVRRCAFVVHPLSVPQLWKSAGMKFMLDAPKRIKKVGEHLAAHYPAFHFGTVEGAVSRSTGQEVICDLYAMPATPKMLLSMEEDFIYQRLVQAAELARKRGACMIGLGAYTKVVGDAGLTVSRRAPIPVTNGNSYSASATLWAARMMVERMGLVKMAPEGKRLQAKAMVIGATGSIGRVSALLLSLVFDELVLVATRADKLLELRQEVLELSPGTRVKVTTNANSELPDTDLVVTATSNQGGAILDMMQVKPGAVICDCSRPLDISPEMVAMRPDVLVIESGEILLPGDLKISVDLGLPQPSVYACLAETVLLTMEGRYEPFSLSKQLSLEKVKEIYRIGVKHGAQLSAICGPNGVVTDEDIDRCRELAREKLKSWKLEVTPA